MAKIKYRIGIDGDVDKSGYCLIRHQPFDKQEIIELGTKPFFDVLKAISDTMDKCEAEGDSLLVCIEAGWQNKTNSYHAAPSKAVAATIGAKVGANHTIGKKIVEYCELNKIPYKLMRPQSKKWDASLFKKITGYDKRSNEEMRDSVRAAWL